MWLVLRGTDTAQGSGATGVNPADAPLPEAEVHSGDGVRRCARLHAPKVPGATWPSSDRLAAPGTPLLTMTAPLSLIRGLRVASDVPLGTFPSATGEPDVVVRLGPASALAVRPSRPGCFEVRAGHVFLGAVGGGVVVARHGREILVDSRPGLDLKALVAVVVGQGIEAVLHQRAGKPARRSVAPVAARSRAASFAVEEILPC